MKCPMESEENADILLAYCGGRLEPAKAAIFEEHLAVCPACRSFQEAQQAVWNSLDAWEVPPVSADFDRRLYARIEAEGEPWWRRMGRPMLIRQGLPIAAAACLLVMAGIIAEQPKEPAGSIQPVVRVETVQAEQVERTLDDMELLHEFTIATGDVKSPGSM